MSSSSSSFYVHFSMLARVGRSPHMHPLHLTRLSAQSLFKPSEIFQLKCARFPPPLTLTLCLLLSSRVLLFLRLSFTLVLKPTSSFIHIPLSLLYLQDGYSGFRPGSPFISFSFSQSLTYIFIHPAIFIYG